MKNNNKKVKQKTNLITVPRIITEEENFPDGTIILKLDIPGQLSTKKNSSTIIKNRKTGYPQVIPSKQFLAYEKLCKEPCETAWKKKRKIPIDFGISVKMKVWLHSWIVGDHTGVMQSLSDILEHWGVVENDKWIHFTDGECKDGCPSEHWFAGVDFENPRVELEIRRYRHPYEKYRSEKEKENILKEERREKRKNKLIITND